MARGGGYRSVEDSCLPGLRRMWWVKFDPFKTGFFGVGVVTV